LILNFHGVGPALRIVDDGEHNCWLDQNHFEAVLDLVKGRPQVKLTFDDGNASDIEVVLPALLRRDLQATFFICSGRLDQPTFLSRAQVRDLRAHGMSIGSHGVDHIPWRRLAPDRLTDELNASRRILEEVCGITIDSAACPFGAYDRMVLRALQRAGYRRVYTSDGGLSTESRWIQPRTTVTRSVTLDEIQRLVKRGVGAGQQFSIGVRRLFKQFR
jgi:peptidoglycan/xylan/chitin deacetylase (PgdA/CDA1 family)